MNNPPSPATPGLVFYLSGASQFQPAESDLPKEVNGQPVAYFWADGIRAGRYVHPAGKFELNVDRQRLDDWVYNYRKMREAGVDVPVPVDHSSKARDNLGYIVDIRREGDRLKLLHQLIGEDAIKLAARNKVSLGIDPAFVDGQGRAFGDCIVHSSLTPVPLVPGQEGLVPMSSEAGEVREGMVFHLAGEEAGGAVAREAGPVATEAEGYRRRVEDLVRRGHITPACGEGVVALMTPSGAGRVLLSREADGSALAEGLLGILSRNVVLTFGERSGVQTLSRVVPGEEPAVNADLQMKMVRMANGGGGRE